VLADNYYQTQSLSVSGVRADKMLDLQAAFIRALERAGKLNRAVEYLPSDDEIAERRLAKTGLTSPERSVLLAYSKMVLFEELLASTLVDDEYVARSLVGYFPTLLQTRYADVMPRHPLRREIIGTVVANTMINRTGSTFVYRMQDETGASAEEVTRAFVLVRDVFGMEELWSQIDALDNQIPAALQSEMFVDAGRLVLRATLWFLRRRRERLPIAQVLEIFQPAVTALRAQLPGLLAEGDRRAFEDYVARLAAKGVPGKLAESLGELDALYAALDVTEVALEQKRDPAIVAALYFALVGDLELRWFAEKITQLPTETSWQALARNALRDDLSSQQRALTTVVTKLSPEETDPVRMLAAWKGRYAPSLMRLRSMTDELKRAGTLDLAVLSVLLRELRSLA